MILSKPISQNLIKSNNDEIIVPSSMKFNEKRWRRKMMQVLGRRKRGNEKKAWFEIWRIRAGMGMDKRAQKMLQVIEKVKKKISDSFLSPEDPLEIL